MVFEITTNHFKNYDIIMITFLLFVEGCLDLLLVFLSLLLMLLFVILLNRVIVFGSQLISMILSVILKVIMLRGMFQLVPMEKNYLPISQLYQ
jgi:hypothetical protein